LTINNNCDDTNDLFILEGVDVCFGDGNIQYDVNDEIEA